MPKYLFIIIFLFLLTDSIQTPLRSENVTFPSNQSLEYYLSALLINEIAFPGEQGYVSEKNSKQAMDNILLVLDARIHYIPHPYKQSYVADTKSDRLIDIITAGGYNGQVKGFYKDKLGRPRFADRTSKRMRYLYKIANNGSPGTFARILNYCIDISENYVDYLKRPNNLFINIRYINQTPVTGRAYSWMTDKYYFHTGGNFVRIPNNLNGSLSGNRFFTLKKLDQL